MMAGAGFRAGVLEFLHFLYYYPSVSSRAATISSGGLVEERDTGPVHGEDCGDRQPVVGSDMVAMGFGDLLNQSVGAEDSELPAHRRRTPALFFQRERGIWRDWPIQQ